MYLAPLNYDRFFKKVFSDQRIAQQFLEDFLNVTITSFEQLPIRHKFTDDATIVEFDYRCEIDDTFVIIDMQQWYKPDLVQRFYIYHALNTGLQLETLPEERYVLDHITGEVKRSKDYRYVEPVITLIWLADETLKFTQNYVAYTMAPELVLQFIQNERLWHNAELREVLEARKEVLDITGNHTKELDFLSRNRLIFILQKNIINQLRGSKYERWFKFAEKSRNISNKREDFDEFRGDTVFEEMMRRLKRDDLSEEEKEYILNEKAMWDEVARVEERFYERGEREGYRVGFSKGERAGLAAGLEKGHKAGLEKGHKEGRKVQAIANARTMLKDGLSIETVAKYTELSVEDVQKLALT